MVVVWVVVVAVVVVVDSERAGRPSTALAGNGTVADATEDIDVDAGATGSPTTVRSRIRGPGTRLKFILDPTTLLCPFETGGDRSSLDVGVG